MCFKVLGILLLLIANLSGIPQRWSTKLGKEYAETAAKVEQAREALASAQQNRDADEKALAEERSHFHKSQQEHVARFPSGCPLDTDVSAVQFVLAAAAASNKDASGDVADQETEDLWQRHRELEKKMQQLLGEMGAQAEKRRKVNLASTEAVAKVAGCLQAAAAKAAEEAGGSQSL